jgi:nucleoside-diphosphate-sugar epimerase
VAKSIFLAGASGVIGRRLAPMLVEAGYRVTGTTRSPERAESLRRAGVKPVVVDVFDAVALRSAVADAAPEVVIHQLTDLVLFTDAATRPEALERNAHIRTQGTANLVAAALMAGARRLIAQSISFVYAPGPEPHRESDVLNNADPRFKRSVEGIVALEREVTKTPGIDGIVLRYGWFYGPGSGADKLRARGSVHVDAAAHAALLAVERGRPGIYNIAEDDGTVSIEKARSEFGFDPAFRSGRSTTP